MKLQSCNNCGVILDADKLNFPSDMWDDEYCIDDAKAKYNHGTGDYGVYVPCPVCKGAVFKATGGAA